MPQTPSYVAVVVLLCTTYALIQSKRNKRLLPLPPSPKSDPLIGHMRTLMGISDEPRAYRDWSKEIGSDIISITLPPGNIIIVLNSEKAANELLVRRASIYSDRPQATMASNENLVGWGSNTGMIGYGDRWRAQRRMTHEVFHKKASEELWPIVVKESREGLQRIIRSPQNFAAEIKRIKGSSILSTVYGYRVTSSDDYLVEVVEAAVAGFAQAAIVSNFYVNVIPWLQYVPEWLPGAGWKRKAKLWNAQTQDMINIPYEWTKNKLAMGDAPPSMLARLLSSGSAPKSEEELDRIRWATGTLFAAGSDTTVASTLVFVMAMTMFPDVQAKAQAELDMVLGGTRLPEMTDRDSMPYLQAVVKEVFRWRTVVPLAVPHRCIEDDVYRGYHIPKGATVIGNIWAMSNNEDVYPNPEKFDPDRFLNPSTPDAPAFGFGRRGCPGRHFAEDALFITASGLLAIFNIRPALDEAGNPIKLEGKMVANALVSQPLPFNCEIKPRSERHEKLLREWID